MIYRKVVDCSGASGTAYSSLSIPNGLVEYLKVTYTNGNAGTGDITISDETDDVTIWSETNGATDVDNPIRKQALDPSGNYKDYERIPITDRIKVVWAGHNANTSIEVVVWYS